MTWTTHQAGGIAALWVLTLLPGALTPSTIGLAVLAASFGALLPDLDSRQNHLRDLSLGGIQPFVLPSYVVRTTAGHRGIMHSYQGAAFVALLFLAPVAVCFGWVTWIALILGYLSHLALDCCTPMGLRLLWPSRHRSFLLPKWARITTGSDLEPLVGVPLLCADLVLLLFLLAHR